MKHLVKAMEVIGAPKVDRQQKYLDTANVIAQEISDAINSGALGVKEFTKLESLSNRLYHIFRELLQNLYLTGSQVVRLYVKVDRHNLTTVYNYIVKNYSKYFNGYNDARTDQLGEFRIPNTEVDKVIDSGYFEDMLDEILELPGVKSADLDYNYQNEFHTEKYNLKTDWSKDYDGRFPKDSAASQVTEEVEIVFSIRDDLAGGDTDLAAEMIEEGRFWEADDIVKSSAKKFGIKLVKMELVDTDSGNPAHAGAYFNVTVKGDPKGIAKWKTYMGVVEE